MRQTSSDTYHAIKENGLLSNRRLEVYEILFNDGPLSANEIIRKARSKYPDVNQTGFNARLSELKQMGVVVEVGERPDEISGNKCYLWDVTEKLPKKLEKDPNGTRKHLIKCREVLTKVFHKFPDTQCFITGQFKKDK